MDRPLRLMLIGKHTGVEMAIFRSFARHPVSLTFVSTDGPMLFPRYPSIVRHEYVPANTLLSDQGMEAITRLLREDGIEAIVCWSEPVACWLQEGQDLARVLMSPPGPLQFLSSKNNQLAIARQSGFQMLPTWFLSMDETLPEIPADAYPLILRPDGDNGAGVVPFFKYKVLDTPQAVQLALQEVQSHDGKLIAQPFKGFMPLVVHGWRSADGRTMECFPFLATRKFGGVTLCLEKAPGNESLFQAAVRFAELTGVVGVFHFDLLWDPVSQEAYFLEINPRFGGTTLKAWVFGYDEPLALLKAFFPERVPGPVFHKNHVRAVVSKKAVLRYAMAALRNRTDLCDYPSESRWKRILWAGCALLRAKDETWTFRDIPGWMSMNMARVRKQRRRAQAGA